MQAACTWLNKRVNSCYALTMSLSKAAKLNEPSFAKDYEVIQMAQRNPSLGIRKLAKCFNCGKTQLCNILKNKVDKYKNDTSSDFKGAGLHRLWKSMICCI